MKTFLTSHLSTPAPIRTLRDRLVGLFGRAKPVPESVPDEAADETQDDSDTPTPSHPMNITTSKVIKNPTNSLYLVKGKGFTAKLPSKAQIFACYDDAEDEVERMESKGYENLIIENAPADAKAPKKGEGSIKQNKDGTSWEILFDRTGRRAGNTAASGRRFRTREEARHHAARFVRIEKHESYELVKVKKPVTAWINKVSGKTNPVIGKMRVNRA